MIKNEYHFLDEFAYKSRTNSIAFIGAGTSELGSWNDFLTDMAIKANRMDIKKWLNANYDKIEIEKIGDELKEELGNELHEYMKETFVKSEADLPKIYHSIVRFPFRFFVTTNYDNYIELAYFKNHGETLKVVYLKNSKSNSFAEEVLISLRENKPFLIKCHGCAMHADSEYIIGSLDYSNLLHDSRQVETMMTAIFGLHSVLILGYGHQDQHINKYFNSTSRVFNGYTLPRYAFGLNHDMQLLKLNRKELKKLHNIDLIEIENFKILPRIMNQLIFCQTYDNYSEIRDSYRLRYENVLKGHSSSVWSFIYYIFVSSDMGSNKTVERAYDFLIKNETLFNKISSEKSLYLMYLLSIGQSFKRLKAPYYNEIAADAFERIIKIITNEAVEFLSPILLSRCYRYAAIFYWNNELDNGYAMELINQSIEIIKKRTISGVDEERDCRKWKSIIEADHKPSFKHISNLLAIGNDPKSNYKKNKAWCMINALEQYLSLSKNRQGTYKTKNCDFDPFSTLSNAITMFEKINHPHGLLYCYTILKKLVINESHNAKVDSIFKLYSDKDVEQLIEAYRIISGCERLVAID